ncbi:hypothetical protein A9R00_01445 [Oleispira antarctica]|uniref:DUF2333 domain-containing protein n=1 Tax=Oleispira antarctica TaxID=188908 RepID=A0A1Y5HVK0_OLEAN|nr:hypothetical protein A9R00_01445 [Oleispira antarctica]
MRGKLNDSIEIMKERIEDMNIGSGFRNTFLASLVIYLLVVIVLGYLWSSEPESFSVAEKTQEIATKLEVKPVVGFATSVTLMTLMETMLDKPGGYLSNDVLPPGVWLDNIPNWEYGVLIQARDLSRALRKDFSRSQSQSTEDKDLEIVEPQFFFDNNSWVVPSSEGEYRRGITALKNYSIRLTDPIDGKAQFYARADNLNQWLLDVETRLGSLSQRLSASVGKRRLNTDLAGDTAARQSTANEDDREVKTPWTEIDDVFYEARGTSWALLHILKAIEIDFSVILEKKNAMVSLRQIIRELEGTQEAVWSPVILNGSGFGLFANHSLVMASYVSRANAAIADLRDLLVKG